jgi:hypothetical protein
MKKIYLAKSNNANPNILYKVRSILSKFNVEVVEYSGGSYSHDLLLSCDELIVIPDISKTYNEMFSHEFYVPLGKGLHDQIDVFKSESNLDNIFIVTEFDDVSVRGFCYGFNYDYKDGYIIQIQDEDDYKNYSHILIDKDSALISPWCYELYLKEIHKLKDESWISDCLNESIDNNVKHLKNEKFKYLLIKTL